MKLLCFLTALTYLGHFRLCTTSQCLTPNSENANCVPLSSCGTLQQAVSSEDETARKFVEASKCEDNSQVCCGTLGNFNISSLKPSERKVSAEFVEAAEKHETRREYVLKHFSSLMKICGFQHYDDYLNHNNNNNTNNAGLDEYPWLVHINYQSPYLHPTPGSEFKCAGALISDELVLTSHSCAGNLITTIKIGQYNKRTNISCVTYAKNTYCSDPVIETSGVRAGVPNTNLILIKLAKKVQFTDFVRPICLPFDESQKPEVGRTVYTSGWGENDITGKTVEIKKKVIHKILASNEGENGLEISFGNNTKYVCEGDQGGPLMYPNTRQWFLAGLINTTPCTNIMPAIANGLSAKTLDNLIDPIFYFLPR